MSASDIATKPSTSKPKSKKSRAKDLDPDRQLALQLFRNENRLNTRGNRGGSSTEKPNYNENKLFSTENYGYGKTNKKEKKDNSQPRANAPLDKELPVNSSVYIYSKYPTLLSLVLSVFWRNWLSDWLRNYVLAVDNLRNLSQYLSAMVFIQNTSHIGRNTNL
jgi:hypothetical protein